MIITRCISPTLRKFPYRISTEVIKRYQQEMAKKHSDLLQQYPRTFEGKIQLLNNPKMIQTIQIVEFGVRYKRGNKWIPILLFLTGLFGYFHQKMLPTRVIDKYFMISGQSNQHYSGYLGASLMYSHIKPFFLYLPLLPVIYHVTRFVKLPHLGILVLCNFLTNSVLGKYLVDQRLSKYEVWDQERMMYGEGMLMSIAYAFWSLVGFKDGFNSLKGNIFLKAIPGLGIIRQGMPIAYFCIFYAALQLFSYYRNSRNSELVVTSVINGIIFGLILKRFKPLLVK